MDHEAIIRGHANLLAASENYKKAIETLRKILEELEDQQWSK